MASDVETPSARHNVSRFFVENRQISWVLFVAVLAWGVWAYRAMPKRKDPDIPVRQVAVITPWPGQSAERVEQLVSRKIEEKLAQNIHLFEIKSISRVGLSVVYAEVDERVTDTAKEFDDFKVKLDSVTDLPEGAGPIQYIKEFGETSALMLTVASPPATDTQIDLLASEIGQKLAPRIAATDIVLCSASGVDASFLREAAELLDTQLRGRGLSAGSRLIQGSSFAAIRLSSAHLTNDLSQTIKQVWEEMPQRADVHPDVWDPNILTSNADIRQALREKAGPKYSYRELDDFTDSIEKAIKVAPEASRVTRVGVLEEQIEIQATQNRLAAFGVSPPALPGIVANRNTTFPAGTLSTGGRDLEIQHTGAFRSLEDINAVVLAQAANGTPLYLRNLATARRSYQHPARFLSYYTWRDQNGNWQNGRAITLAVE